MIPLARWQNKLGFMIRFWGIDTALVSSTHQCFLAKSLVSDHPGGLGLVGLGLAMLLDVVVAQHDGQPSHLLGSHAETGQVVVFKKCLLDVLWFRPWIRIQNRIFSFMDPVKSGIVSLTVMLWFGPWLWSQIFSHLFDSGSRFRSSKEWSHDTSNIWHNKMRKQEQLTVRRSGRRWGCACRRWATRRRTGVRCCAAARSTATRSSARASRSRRATGAARGSSAKAFSVSSRLQSIGRSLNFLINQII